MVKGRRGVDIKAVAAAVAIVVGSGQFLLAAIVSARTAHHQRLTSQLALESNLSTYEFGLRSIEDITRIDLSNTGTRQLAVTVGLLERCSLNPGDTVSPLAAGPWPMRVEIADPILPVAHIYHLAPDAQGRLRFSERPTRVFAF
jgi:hypothetical protein